jgi:NADH-quinone oxidoreductase subunit F
MSMVKSADTHPLTWRLDHGSRLDLQSRLRGTRRLRCGAQGAQGDEPRHGAQLVKDSNLRGRGGAGLPHRREVEPGADGPDAGPSTCVCNADEMEPGTFKDRLLMEQLPHQLVESMIVAGWAFQATRAYIFLRGEYILAAERLKRAHCRGQGGRLPG